MLVYLMGPLSVYISDSPTLGSFLILEYAKHSPASGPLHLLSHLLGLLSTTPTSPVATGLLLYLPDDTSLTTLFTLFWICWVLVAACGIFAASCGVFPWGAWPLSSCGRQAPELAGFSS